jgi:DNA-binding transcriptional ArsR family regulator
MVFMPVVEVLGDLLALDELALNDGDASRRDTLRAIRDHIAQRDQGAKVSDAADVLGVSQPTIRSWLDAGILGSVVGSRPVRIELLSLAEVKRALEAVREIENEGQILASVRRFLRDKAVLAGAEEGLAEGRLNRTRPIGDDLRAELSTLVAKQSAKSLKSR